MKLFDFLKKPSTMIFLGVAGLVVTNILTAKATVKYVEKCAELDHEPTKEETIKLMASCYGPAVGTAIIATGAILSANSGYLNTQNSLLSNFKMLNTKYKDQKDSIISSLGVKDLLKLEEKTLEKAKEHPYSGNIEVMIEGYDEIIETTMEELMDAELQFEKEFATEQQVGIGYLQELLGMRVDVNAKGFNIEYLYDKYGGGLSKEDRERCNFIIIDWDLILENNNQYYVLHFPQEPIVGWDIKSA